MHIGTRSPPVTGFTVTATACLSRERRPGFSRTMAVFETIRKFLVPPQAIVPEPPIEPAGPTTYSVRPLTVEQLEEVLRLNLRCFRNGENYTKHTFSYLLDEPRTLSYSAVTESGEIVGFVFVMT